MAMMALNQTSRRPWVHGIQRADGITVNFQAGHLCLGLGQLKELGSSSEIQIFKTRLARV
jgi:hypothetical protein